jgi:hypothetical protein
VLAGLLLALPWARAAEDAPAAEAQKVASAWLALIDAGDYGRSWDEAASIFKSALTRADWERAARAARGPLGKVESRSLRTATVTRTLPGAPDGEYVVLQFDTRFAKKAAAVETVTPMRDQDGAWRVSGYYIR